MQDKIVVVGSGLVGSLWAYILKKRGFDVELYEKRSDPKFQTAPAGRSINLVITSRGLHGLKTAGLLEKILPITVPVYGRRIHPKTGETVFQPYGRDKTECNYSVSRWDLNKAMINACLEAGIQIHFEHDASHVDPRNKKITFKTPAGEVTKSYSRLFATDGAGSAVRKSLLTNFPLEFQESVDWLTSDYKELHMPKLAGERPAIVKNDLHIWPRATHMMMGLANGDNSFTMTLYLPQENHPFAFSNLQTEAQVEALFKSEFLDSIPFLPNYKKEFLENPQGKLATVRMSKWVYDDSIALMGDAAHAIVPFFGQGMNLGFEDCTTLLKILDDNKFDWIKSFAEYDQTQRPNANAIADMALENFIEMRDKVGDTQFQFKKKLEGLIEKEFPHLYRSRYGLITYTLVPYAIAQQIGLRQSRLLEDLSRDLESPEKLNLEMTKQILEKDFFPWARDKGLQTHSYRP